MAEAASATFSAVQSGSQFQYSLTLNNIGTTQIGTYWFAWDDVPDQDFMTSQPVSVTAPIGWTPIVTHFPGTGYGIEFVASGPTTALAAGQSLSGFGFTSPDTPAMLSGQSQIDPSFATTSSFVYQTTAFADPGFNFVTTAACFRAGTRIATPGGACAIERLQAGDLVCTLGGAERPVVWIGHRRIDCRRHPDPRQAWPVRIPAGAFGAGLPSRGLDVSPDHALFVEGVLIPARCLLGCGGIRQVPVDTATYWHIELDRHDLLLAEGLPAESYLDVGDRGMFDNEQRPRLLHPKLAAQVREAEGCAPLVMAGPELDRVRSWLGAAERFAGAAAPKANTDQVKSSEPQPRRGGRRPATHGWLEKTRISQPRP